MSKADLRDPERWLSRDIFAAYCGTGSDALLAYYDKAKRKRQLMTADFDWLAVLALPAWLGLRQQWTLWGTLVGLLAAASLVELFTHIRLPPGAFTGGLLAIGLMARGMLLTNAQGLYLKLKQRGLDEAAITAAMRDKAKQRIDMACIALLAALAVSALPLLVPD